jgi:hypothetical protein
MHISSLLHYVQQKEIAALTKTYSKLINRYCQPKNRKVRACLYIINVLYYQEQ